jgi:hypothetical protein
MAAMQYPQYTKKVNWGMFTTLAMGPGQEPTMINTNNLQRDHGLSGHDYHAQYAGAPLVDWTTPGLYITRLRMIGDHGVLDVSYCHGRLKDGTLVRVQLPFDQLRLRGVKRSIVEWAIKDGVHAARMGALDNLSILH